MGNMKIFIIEYATSTILDETSMQIEQLTALWTYIGYG